MLYEQTGLVYFGTVPLRKIPFEYVHDLAPLQTMNLSIAALDDFVACARSSNTSNRLWSAPPSQRAGGGPVIVTADTFEDKVR